LKTHDSVSGVKPTSAWISGSATPMMEVSMITMNCASAMTARADQRRGFAVCMRVCLSQAAGCDLIR
jgi:hypothetical protein